MVTRVTELPPLVTVAIPARNAAPFIGEALRSIRAQTFKRWEVVVVDDGSTDATRHVITAFADPRFRVLPNARRRGVSGASNTAIDVARGRYLARLDSDDLMHPRRLETQVAFLERNAAVAVCGSNVKLIGEAKGEWRYPEDDSELRALLLLQCSLGHSAVMIRRATLVDHAVRYDESLETGEDYDLWTRICSFGRLHSLPTVLTSYRSHPDQATKRAVETARGVLRNLRERLLRWTLPDVDERGFALHEKLATLQYEINETFLVDSISWLNHLMASNRARQFFDAKGLRAVLGRKLRDVCLTLSLVGYPVVSPLARSGWAATMPVGSWVHLAANLVRAHVRQRAGGRS